MAMKRRSFLGWLAAMPFVGKAFSKNESNEAVVKEKKKCCYVCAKKTQWPSCFNNAGCVDFEPARKYIKIFTTEPFDRVIQLVHWQDRLFICCESGIWEIERGGEFYNISHLTTVISTVARMRYE